MSEQVIAALQQQLETGPGFSSYQEIVEWLEQEQGKKWSMGRCISGVRYRLGAKLKVPRPQSYKQDETAVEGFKKKTRCSAVESGDPAGPRQVSALPVSG